MFIFHLNNASLTALLVKSHNISLSHLYDNTNCGDYTCFIKFLFGTKKKMLILVDWCH